MASDKEEGDCFITMQLVVEPRKYESSTMAASCTF